MVEETVFEHLRTMPGNDWVRQIHSCKVSDPLQPPHALRQSVKVFQTEHGQTCRTISLVLRGGVQPTSPDLVVVSVAAHSRNSVCRTERQAVAWRVAHRKDRKSVV